MRIVKLRFMTMRISANNPVWPMLIVRSRLDIFFNNKKASCKHTTVTSESLAVFPCESDNIFYEKNPGKIWKK